MSEKPKPSGEYPHTLELKKKIEDLNQQQLPSGDRKIARVEQLLSGPPPVGDVSVNVSTLSEAPPPTEPAPTVPPLAGPYTITVKGKGPHNNDLVHDADRTAARLVAELRAAGHEIEHASFTNGNERNLLVVDVALPSKTSIKSPTKPLFRAAPEGTKDKP